MRQSRWLVPAIMLTMLLIVSFQTFWIVKSYQAEKKLLQVQCTVLLRETFYDTWHGGRQSMESRRQRPRPFPPESLEKFKEPDWEENDTADSAEGYRPRRHIEPHMLGRLQPDSLGPFYQAKLNELHPHFRARLVILSENDTLPPSMGTLRTLTLPWHWETKETLAADITGFGSELSQRLIPYVCISLVIVICTIGTMLLLYRTIRRSQRLALQQRQFISDVTHELKTPVATVKVALEALKNFSALDDRNKTQEYLSISILELNRLNNMADRILQVSQMESGSTPLHMAECDLGQLARASVEAMRPLSEQRKSHLTLLLQERQFPFRGDSIMITNAIVNLIENALKYCPPESNVQVTVTQRENAYQMTVEDNGPGIKGEHKDRIFEKFYRIREGDEYNVRGYGLGLSYVREAMHLHQGTVKVESSIGKGSKFIITLPRVSNE